MSFRIWPVFMFALAVAGLVGRPVTAQVLPETSQTLDQATVSFQDCDASGLTFDSIQTQNAICEQGLTQPSLWWMKDQVGSQLRNKKLINGWRAEAATARLTSPKVILTVNSQAWSLLDYFERYEFLHAFGLASQDFGYALEVRDSRNVEMGTYRCGGDRCEIRFGNSDSGFRGQRRSPF